MCLVSGYVLCRHGRLKAYVIPKSALGGDLSSTSVLTSKEAQTKIEKEGRWRQVFEECDLVVNYSAKKRRFYLTVKPTSLSKGNQQLN